MEMIAVEGSSKMFMDQIDESYFVLSDDEIEVVSGGIAPLVVAAYVVAGAALGAAAGYYANRDRKPNKQR